MQLVVFKQSVVLCDQSAFDDPSVIIKWEEIPLHFTPEALKLKKTWVKSLATFKIISNVLHFNPAVYTHTSRQAHKWNPTARVVTGISPESKGLVLHCDFSKDLAQAMAYQSLCKYLSIISFSLFISIAHSCEPVTNKRGCRDMIHFCWVLCF